jgi:hypothetical protein
MKQRFTLTFLCLLFMTMLASAQKPRSDSAFSSGLLFANYSYQFPGADLAKRFGANSSVGFGSAFKSSKNWIFGGEINYLFGSKVKEDSIFRNLETSEGFMIDEGGTYAEVYLSERGWNLSAKIGKIITFGTSDKNSGLLLSGGINFLQHKIRIENPGKTAPQVQGDYARGYDRLTNGWGLSESVGYIFFSQRKIYNFYGGLEFTQVWTHSQRAYDFDMRAKDSKTRLDLLFGIKVGWVVPFNKRSSQVFYYY